MIVDVLWQVFLGLLLVLAILGIAILIVGVVIAAFNSLKTSKNEGVEK